jgi:hypothetical protein
VPRQSGHDDGAGKLTDRQKRVPRNVAAAVEHGAVQEIDGRDFAASALHDERVERVRDHFAARQLFTGVAAAELRHARNRRIFQIETRKCDARRPIEAWRLRRWLLFVAGAEHGSDQTPCEHPRLHCSS